MRTEQTFDAMRSMPVEIPPEKVEQFVLAQVAAGTIAVAAATVVKKSAFFFHLNTILMTTAAAATLTTLAVIFYPGEPSGTLAAKNTPPPSAQENRLIVEPEKEEWLTAVDTPETKIVQPETKTITHVIVVTGKDTVSNTKTTTLTPADAPKPVVIVQGSNVRVQPNPADYMFTYYQAEPFKSPTEQLEEMERMDELDRMDRERAKPDAMEAELAELEAAQAELEAAEAEMEAAEAEMQAAQAEMEAAQAEMASAKACTERDNRLISVIEEALIVDSLITDTQHYSFSFNDRSLTVNGKKQSGEMWEKYKNLITSNSGYRISRRFHFSVSKNGKQVTTTINN